MTIPILYNDPFRPKSFERRNGRLTLGQTRAIDELSPQYGLTIAMGMLDVTASFGRDAPVFMEIGFGTGQSLLAAAKQFPHFNFIGVETHQPGIGALYLGMQLQNIHNIRVYHEDVIEVLKSVIPTESLSGLQIFFPDPWPKRRHHPRRLLQADFLKLILPKLTAAGELHLATDWEDYAKHMQKVVSAENNFKNLAGPLQFGQRSLLRPILSKFEKRALREGRLIWDLQMQKILQPSQ